LTSTFVTVINVLVLTKIGKITMSKVAQIDEQIAALQAARVAAMQEERAAVVAQVRKHIVDYKITATELKGLVKGRVTDQQVKDFLEKQAKKAAKSKP
jgi:Na+-transporting NADH:ubiquinone oxidoreductase subunit NqrC